MISLYIVSIFEIFVVIFGGFFVLFENILGLFIVKFFNLLSKSNFISLSKFSDSLIYGTTAKL